MIAGYRAARKLFHQKASDYWKSKITSAGTNRRHVWQSVNQLLGDGKNTTKAGSFSAATYVTGSGKSGLKSPMIKQQKLAEMPFRWKIFNFRFLAYIIK